MINNQKLIVLMFGIIMALLLVVIGSYILFKQKTNADTANIANVNDVLTIDYTNIDSAVASVLKTMPEIKAEIKEIKSTMNKKNMSYSVNNTRIEDVPIEELFSVKKRQFRLEVENRLANKKSDDNTEAIAEEFTNNYLEAISIAKEVYGVTVSQEEITKYIENNIAPIVVKEKEAYAKALGLTLNELDYAFDRDIYVMDTLWKKLYPVLFEKYPQQNGEDDNAYLERIKKEFYSHKKR